MIHIDAQMTAGPAEFAPSGYTQHTLRITEHEVDTFGHLDPRPKVVHTFQGVSTPEMASGVEESLFCGAARLLERLLAKAATA